VSGTIVVVSGACVGAGRATARAFAERGYDVALLARGAESLDAAAADIGARGPGRVLALPTDVADAAQVDRAAAQIERELGPIDVWINAAMTSVFAPVRERVAEEVRRTTDVTYTATCSHRAQSKWVSWGQSKRQEAVGRQSSTGRPCSSLSRPTPSSTMASLRQRSNCGAASAGPS
jgi:NAD(P)-dependent dehydrogenase (short-subunit alcohol dehydrogenase family)